MRQTWTLPLADGAAATGFSLDDLTLALLVGSLVLVVSVAAVRLSLRSGLPSLLIYLGIGLVLGESGFGIRYDNQQLTQVLGYAALVLILVEGGLTTQWSGIRRSVAPAAVLATVGRRRVGARRRRGGPRAARVVLADRLPRRRGARVDRCRGRLLRAAPRAAPPADLGDARGRVRLQRRPGRAPRDRDRRRPRPRSDPGPVVADRARRRRSSWSGGAVIGLAIGWAGRAAAAARGDDVVGAVRDRGGVGGGPRVRRGRLRCTRRGSSPATSRRSCSATSGCPHRPAVVGFATAIGWLAQIGLFVLLGLLASPSRLRGRAGARPRRRGGAAAPRATPVRARVVHAVRDVVAHPGVPVVGRAARCRARSCSPPCRARWAPPAWTWIFDLVFVLVVVFTIVQAPTLPWVARRLGVDTAHHRVDLAVETTPLDRPRRRAARDRHRPAVADRRGAGVRAAAAGRGQRRPRRARGQVVRARGRTTCCGTATSCSSSLRARCAGAIERRLRAVSRGGRLAEWADD